MNRQQRPITDRELRAWLAGVEVLLVGLLLLLQVLPLRVPNWLAISPQKKCAGLLRPLNAAMSAPAKPSAWAMGITDQDLNDADARLAAQRAEALRRRQIVQVCGEDFDASDENRSLLWHFLDERVEFQRLATESPMDLGRHAALLPVDIAKTRERKEPPNTKQTKPTQRQPKAVDELIGLAGEIYVFKMLRHRYGADVVTSSSWISSNSRHVFEDNVANDGAGCDFAFTSGGRSYRVEVKASAGDEPAFTLGSSEIALAMELAKRKKGRRDRFVLVHVRNALSASPEAVVLPNPYASDGTNVFRIDQADARIRYRERT